MLLEGVPDEATLARGLSWSDMKVLPPGVEKAVHYLVSGLGVDSVQHKEACIEQALAALGVDLQRLVEQLRAHGCTYEKGIPP